MKARTASFKSGPTGDGRAKWVDNNDALFAVGRTTVDVRSSVRWVNRTWPRKTEIGGDGSDSDINQCSILS